MAVNKSPKDSSGSVRTRTRAKQGQVANQQQIWIWLYGSITKASPPVVEQLTEILQRETVRAAVCQMLAASSPSFH